MKNSWICFVVFTKLTDDFLNNLQIVVVFNNLDFSSIWLHVSACASPIPEHIGDRWCNDENNNAGCGYDGGDCCGPNVKTQRCSDCQCLGENMMSNTAPGPFCACSINSIIGCKWFFNTFFKNQKYFEKLIEIK